MSGPAGGLAPSKRMYWGAWIAGKKFGGEAPWSMNALGVFARDVGSAPSLVHFSGPFEDCRSGTCSPVPFPTAAFEDVRAYGAIPFFSWGSDSLPVSVSQPAFSLQAIAAGSWDGYIAAWASAARSWGHPFFLRFNWEMNGHWFPWAEGVNGNVAGQYVQAWRHVHDIFTSVGATNATWVWCADAEANSASSLASLYPGDAYVDWTCLDGYNRGRPWKSFERIFGASYEEITTTIAPTKPMVIGETASTEKGGSKAAWITDALSVQLPLLFPKISAFLWFAKGDSPYGWPVESSSGAQAAFAAAIASPAYVSNRFSRLGRGTIGPP